MHGKEKIAKVLGYSGLIPFVTFSIACWVPLPLIDDAASILIMYAAVILSFMGAIHWGIVLVSSADNNEKYLIASVIPALVAWFALMMPQPVAIGLLLAGFIALLSFDQYIATSQKFPAWYVPMRLRLTFIVSVCLVVSLTALTTGAH